MSTVTKLNTRGGPESESQNIYQCVADVLGDQYHYANAIDSSLIWTVGYTPYIPPALKGRSFPSVENFFLDEWEPLTVLQTPQVLSTSVSIEEDNLIQSAAGLVSQVLSTSVAIVENDLIQSAAGLVSQVLSTSVAIVENDLIQSAAGLVSQVLSTSVAIVESDLIQSAAGLVSQVLSTSVAIVENDLIQSAAGLLSQVLSSSDTRVKDRIDSTLRDSNQPEVHVADVSTERSRLVITISMFSIESSNASVPEVDAIATSLEHWAEEMSTSTTDGHIVSSTAVANQKKTRSEFVSSLRRLFTRKNRMPAKVASKKEHIHLVDHLNAEVTH
ncbi:uncharacterized protein LOC127932315 [Oncorhynchus keta]|uniref:uncharacterized protein LOC127932315 n=1 Tax=Oncorhynchus keta TaxID=8018 RepID=UPI00227C230A|nr:uncharacterized protein LOC127932315 [Oncorhynchus keta]